MRDESLRIRDMLGAIEKIEGRFDEGADLSMLDELQQIWFVYHLQVIGEAACTMSTHTRDRYPKVDWKGIIGMRQKLVHDYFEIDFDIVDSVIRNELPILKPQLEAIIADMEAQSE